MGSKSVGEHDIQEDCGKCALEAKRKKRFKEKCFSTSVSANRLGIERTKK